MSVKAAQSARSDRVVFCGGYLLGVTFAGATALNSRGETGGCRGKNKQEEKKDEKKEEKKTRKRACR